MTAKIITRILLLLTPLIWIAWDLYAYLTVGNSVTESATLYKFSFYAPGASFLVGILCGHLFFPQAEIIKEIADDKARRNPGSY